MTPDDEGFNLPENPEVEPVPVKYAVMTGRRVLEQVNGAPACPREGELIALANGEKYKVYAVVHHLEPVSDGVSRARIEVYVRVAP